MKREVFVPNATWSLLPWLSGLPVPRSCFFVAVGTKRRVNNSFTMVGGITVYTKSKQIKIALISSATELQCEALHKVVCSNQHVYVIINTVG